MVAPLFGGALAKSKQERCTRKGMEPEADAQCTVSRLLTPSLTSLQPSLTTLQLLTCPCFTSSRDATLAVSMQGRVGGSSAGRCAAEERRAGDASVPHCACCLYDRGRGGGGGESRRTSGTTLKKGPHMRCSGGESPLVTDSLCMLRRLKMSVHAGGRRQHRTARAARLAPT